MSLRSMTIYWACREAGLLSFVKANYLEDMARTASCLEGFDFKVKIFHTDKNHHVFKETAGGDVSSSTDEENTAWKRDESAEDSSLNDSEQILDSDDNSAVMKEEPSSKDAKAELANHSGHNMELARMMPARFRHIRWNIPYFAVFSGSVWLGFHIEFYPYDYSSTDLKGFSEQVWITFFVFLLFVGVGIVVESMVLHFRKYWPAPRPDDFDIVSSSKMDAKKQDKMTASLASTDISGLFELHHGRPGPEDVFVDARRANAPGIFLCGPAPMVQMVRQEARQENSYFGLTRYVLYEESFEM